MTGQRGRFHRTTHARVTADNEELRNDRENLRVDVATLKERENQSLIEIPASILTGFAINILTTDLRNIVGWLLLILGLFILFFLRKSKLIQITKIFSRNKE